MGYETRVPPMVFPDHTPPAQVELADIGNALEWEDPRRPGVEFRRVSPTGFACPSPWERLYLRWVSDVCRASLVEEPATPEVPTLTPQQLIAGNGWASPSSVPNEIVVRRCDTRRGEAIAAARRIRLWLDERELLGTEAAAAATDDVLVLLPWTRSRLDLWRRVFESYDLPFRPGNTDKLFEKPIARWVSAVAEVLQWKDRAVSRASLREVVDGPFWSASAFAQQHGCESRGLRWRFGELLRSFRGDLVNHDRWVRHVETLRNIAKSEDKDTASYDAAAALSRALHDAARDDASPIRDLAELLGIKADGAGVFDVWSRLNAKEDNPFAHRDEAKVAFGAIARLLERLHYEGLEANRAELPHLLRTRFRETMLEPGDEYEHGPLLMPYELYDGRSAELLLCAGLGEGEFPRPAPHFTSTDRAWIHALDLGDPDEFSRTHVERDVTRLAVAMDRCLTNDGEVHLSWALEGSGTEIVYPGAALSLLIGGWSESDWHDSPDHVETVRAADEMPRRLDDAASESEARLFAHDDQVLDWLDEHATTPEDVARATDFRTESSRLASSRAALRERAPAPADPDVLGAHSGMLPGRIGQPTEGYSASGLENYGRCPSQYFFRRVLRIRDDTDAGEFPDHLEIGNAVHDALFRAATELIAAAEDNLWRMVSPEDEWDDARRAVHSAIEDELDQVLARTSLSGALIKPIADRWRDSLDLWLDLHLRSNRFPRIVAHAEFAMNADYGESDPRSISEPAWVDVDGVSFPVRGKIDRVDFDPTTGNIAIRDYKSGSGKRSWSLEQQIAEGMHVQLPLYAMAIEALIAAGELPHLSSVEKAPVAGEVSLEFVLDPGYASVSLDDSAKKLQDAGGSQPSWRDIARRWIASHVQSAEAGRFPLRPTECPLEGKGFCDFQRVCGYTPGRELPDLRLDVPSFEEVKAERSSSDANYCRTLASPPSLSASFDLDDARRRHSEAQQAAIDVSSDVAISAGAGTGKTYNLVLRYLSALAPDPDGDVAPADPSEILCVTFTRRAAGEMKKRIREALLGEPDVRQSPFVERIRQDSERLRRILLELSNAPVLTIDAAASMIFAEAMSLRNQPEDYEVVASSDVEAELQAFCSRAFARDLERDEGYCRHLQALTTSYPPALLRDQLAALMTSGIPPGLAQISTLEDRADAILDEWRQAAQLALADYVRGALEIWDADTLERIAVPEQHNGKNIEFGFQQNDELVALLRRIESTDPANWLEEELTGAAEFLNGLVVNQNTQGKDTPLYNYMKPGGTKRGKDLDLRIRFQPERHAAIKAWKSCDDAEELATFAARATFVAEEWDQEFRAHLRRRGRLRYGDVERAAVEALTNEDSRTELARRFPFRHIFVDEVQDTNENQHRLIDALAEAASEATGEHCRRFFVGDLKQSIYRFRGAEVDVFARRLTEYPHHSLALNFRSTPQLLQAFNALFADLLPATTDPRAEIPYEPLAPGLEDEPDTQLGAPVELIAAADDTWQDDALEEASSVFDVDDETSASAEVTSVTRQVEAATVRRIAELVEQVDTSGPEPVVAVLVHAWNRAHYYHELLAAAGIPAAVQGGSGLLSTREVSNLVTWLEAICLPERRTAQLGCLRSAGVAISDVALYCLSQGFGLPDTERQYKALEAARKLPFDAEDAVTRWAAADPELDRDAALAQLTEDATNLERFRREYARLRTELYARPASEVFASFIERNGLRGFWHGQGQGRQRVANLERFLDLVRDFEESHGVSPLALVRHLDSLREGDDPAAGGLEASGGAPVVLTTYWQAKGLEWPIVVLPDVQRTTTGSASHGLAPERVVISEGGIEKVAYLMTPKRALDGKARGHAKSDISDVASQFVGPALRAELRRQLYVAMTRAQQKVLISGVFSLPSRSLARQDVVGAGHCETKNWADALRMGLDIRFDAGTPYFGNAATSPDRHQLLSGTLGIAAPQPVRSEPSLVSPVEPSLPGRAAQHTRWSSALCSPIERRNPSDEPPVAGLPAPNAELTLLPERREQHTTPFGHETVEGTAFHRLMELLAFSEFPKIDAAIDQVFEELLIEESEGDPRRARLHTLWARAMEQESLVEELRGAAKRGELYHEVPFRHQDDEGVWYDGLIDLVWKCNDGLVHLLDYKTGAHPTSGEPVSDKLRRHFAQVALYERSLVSDADDSLATFGVWYVTGGAVVRWRPSGSRRDRTHDFAHEVDSSDVQAGLEGTSGDERGERGIEHPQSAPGSSYEGQTSTPFHSIYYAHELSRAGGSGVDRLGRALFDACVDLNPHQIEAALFVLRSPISKGALLADEVGLGKTIEAGLVMCQYWAEKRRHMLVISPASLRKQWAQELAEKFNMPSLVLDGRAFKQLRREGRTNPFNTRRGVVIASMHFVANHAELVKEIPWDLVVIDEAHKLRNCHRKSNTIGRNIRWATEDRQKLLLTATPLQNSLLELYGLSTLIDSRLFGDKAAFRDQYCNKDGDLETLRRRLQAFCHRNLRKEVTEFVQYTRRKPVTIPFTPTEKEHRLYEALSEYLKREDTYAFPTAQKHLLVMLVRKLLASSPYAVAGTLEKIRERLTRLRDRAIQHRQQSWSFSGNELDGDLWEQLLTDQEDKLDSGDDEPLVAEEAEELKEVELNDLNHEIGELDDYIRWAHGIGIDTKTRALKDALGIAFEKLQEMGAAQKVVVFTESRRTQEWLRDFLVANGYAGEVLTFNGVNSDQRAQAVYQEWLIEHQETGDATGSRDVDIRTAIIDRFRDDAKVLIATEAGAEGLNLQFCSALVNFDLPWNPQRIEQRIGRCHRYGQKHDVVVINFLNEKNAADQRVFELLGEKFSLFSGVFGASDDVLGSLESGVDLESRILKIYQSCRTPDEIDEAFKSLQLELEDQIQSRLKSTRSLLLEHFDQDVHDRIKVNLDGTREKLDRIGRAFWQLTKDVLGSRARFDDHELSFQLLEPVPQVSHRGEYHLISKEHENHPGAFLYRLSHPLGERVLELGRNIEAEPSEVIFDISNHPTKLTLVEGLKGQSGWLRLDLLRIESYDAEEYLLFSAIDDDGNNVDQETCEKLFQCSTSTTRQRVEVPPSVDERLSGDASRHLRATIDANLQENNRYFQEAREQLDRWARDMELAAEKKLDDVKRQIREQRRLSRQATTMQDQHQHQKEERKLQRKKRRLRQEIFDVEDQIAERREDLIEALERRMEQDTESTHLFTIRWQVI